jgi:hypothetical protein
MARNAGIRHASTSFKQFFPGRGRELDAERSCGRRPGAITVRRQPFGRSGDIDPEPVLTPRAPPQPAPSIAAPPPASAIGTPAPPVPSIAPLSSQQSPSTPSSGGLPRQGTLALSPGSRSEGAPSAAGGGGRTLNDCMEFWEPTTHMTKQEWRAACKRTLGRIQ